MSDAELNLQGLEEKAAASFIGRSYFGHLTVLHKDSAYSYQISGSPVTRERAVTCVDTFLKGSPTTIGESR